MLCFVIFNFLGVNERLYLFPFWRMYTIFPSKPIHTDKYTPIHTRWKTYEASSYLRAKCNILKQIEIPQNKFIRVPKQIGCFQTLCLIWLWLRRNCWSFILQFHERKLIQFIYLSKMRDERMGQIFFINTYSHTDFNL